MTDLDRRFSVPFVHRFRSTRAAFDPANPTILHALDAPAAVHTDTTTRHDRAPVGVFVDQGLVDAQPDLPDRVRAYADAHAHRLDLRGLHTVTGGEAIKNDPLAWQHAVADIDRMRLCRHSFVLIVGGGAVLDAVGFAAAVAHRGVRVVRQPSTTVSQGDSGVGVKCGVNAFGRKNYLGCFATPFAVINDHDLLATLPDRVWRAGFSEAVKAALLKDPAFFERLEREATAIDARTSADACAILDRSAILHLDHITLGGDPFELTTARPLDFGHWAAHKLEQLTSYDVLHGEAVALGLALDITYSALAGIAEPHHARRAVECLEALGFELFHPALLDPDALLAGLDEFREHLGGRLTITLLHSIGRGIDAHDIHADTMRRALDELQRRHATRSPSAR